MHPGPSSCRCTENSSQGYSSRRPAFSPSCRCGILCRIRNLSSISGTNNPCSQPSSHRHSGTSLSLDFCRTDRGSQCFGKPQWPPRGSRRHRDGPLNRRDRPSTAAPVGCFEEPHLLAAEMRCPAPSTPHSAWLSAHRPPLHLLPRLHHPHLRTLPPHSPEGKRIAFPWCQHRHRHPRSRQWNPRHHHHDQPPHSPESVRRLRSQSPWMKIQWIPQHQPRRDYHRSPLLHLLSPPPSPLGHQRFHGRTHPPHHHLLLHQSLNGPQGLGHQHQLLPHSNRGRSLCHGLGHHQRDPVAPEETLQRHCCR
mmetsp:Transcript_26350/g.54677  ORF Transcript_26350/g.54677 Transcript_26350/m.54677 type:complete len:307 (-) Transcript_26350:102-1022(-)